MSLMKKEDIQHLALLARLELSNNEVDKFAHQFNDILGYVDKIKDITREMGDEKEELKIENTVSKNIFRDDLDGQEGGVFSGKILKEAPNTKDGFVKVKKIINND